MPVYALPDFSVLYLYNPFFWERHGLYSIHQLLLISYTIIYNIKYIQVKVYYNLFWQSRKDSNLLYHIAELLCLSPILVQRSIDFKLNHPSITYIYTQNAIQVKLYFYFLLNKRGRVSARINTFLRFLLTYCAICCKFHPAAN